MPVLSCLETEQGDAFGEDLLARVVEITHDTRDEPQKK
jgi:hypothetical protein